MKWLKTFDEWRTDKILDTFTEIAKYLQYLETGIF